MSYGGITVAKWIRAAIAVVALTPLYAQYGGPAILARGQAPTAMTPSKIDFRPFLSVSAGYDTGLRNNFRRRSVSER